MLWKKKENNKESFWQKKRIEFSKQSYCLERLHVLFYIYFLFFSKWCYSCECYWQAPTLCCHTRYTFFSFLLGLFSLWPNAWQNTIKEKISFVPPFVVVVYYCGLEVMVIGTRDDLLLSWDDLEAEKGDANIQ